MKNKLFIYTIILILFISFISPFEIGVSPAKLIFEGKQNTEICRNFSVFNDEGRTFNGEIKWSREKIKDISKYILSSKEANINIKFPEKVKSGKYEICLSSEKEGEKYGVLSYKLENSSYAIGIWVEVKITKNDYSVFSLTGKIVEENSLTKIFIFTPLLLIIVLLLLLLKLKKKNRELV
jgi:hypothetical protein